MKSIKILTILVLAFGLIVCLPKAGRAEPIGTAFTYQGRLLDANTAADGLYDLQFTLYDAVSDGNAVGFNIRPDVDVIDGYFTTVLDFNSVFDGNARWLEIGVRPGDLYDPNVYTTLSPRQEVTAAPYTLYAKTAENVFGGIVGGGTSNYVPKFLSSNSIGNSVIYESGGNVGIGTASPAQDLEVKGGVFIDHSGGAHVPAEGGIALTVDGRAGKNILRLRDSEANTAMVVNHFGKVGIGTSSPTAKLEVNGQVRITDGTQAAGKVLTSDSVGLAIWQTPYSGDITAVNAGTGLSGGGTSGDVTLAVNVPLSLTGASSTVAVIDATNTGTGYGVRGKHNSSGNLGSLGTSFEGVSGWGDQGEGVFGYSYSDAGVHGISPYGTAGVWGEGSEGVHGSGDNYGVYGENNSGCYGYLGSAGTGVYGGGGSVGVYGDGALYGVYGAGYVYDFYAGGTGIDYGSASSIRWKRDIQPIDKALDKIMNLRGVYFNWDPNHGGKHDVGMIAEEVGKVLPEIVQYEQNGTDAIGMDYSKTTPLLVEAIKALKVENDELKRRLAVIEAAIGKNNGGDKQ